jgi:hypothetical protein
MLKVSKGILSLERQREFLNGQVASRLTILENKLKPKYFKLFSKQLKSEIAKAFANLDKSNDYCYNQHGEIQHWIHAHELLAMVPKQAREYFAEYINDYHCAYIDWDNDTLYYLGHGEIVINHEGDIYDGDSQKWIIKRDDYRDDNGDYDLDKRNELIEAYMEKSGYYPGVFESDYNGNLTAVSTQPKAKVG